MPMPISDKAEVSVDFPDKFYFGSFSQESRYNVSIDDVGVHISLDREGEEKRHVAFHLHHHLFSDILEAIAAQVADHREALEEHRERLDEAVTKLAHSLKRNKKR